MVRAKDWLQQITEERDRFFRNPSSIFKALEFGRIYSSAYNHLIKTQVVNASNVVFRKPAPPGATIFSFGAPARNEMVGRSDADIAIYLAHNSAKEREFKEYVVRGLQDFGFTKIDTAIGGTVNDLRRHMRTSIIETNMVMESQFICGDTCLSDKIEQLRSALYDPASIARNLTFQFFYFRQYFYKKASADYQNLKYCNGGTRDLLFPIWYAHLKKGIARDLQISALERGLNALEEDELLSQEAVRLTLRASSAIRVIRAEVMDLTPNDEDGKIWLQKAIELCEKNPHLFESPEEVLKIVANSSRRIRATKARVWDGLCDYFIQTKGSIWNIHFKKLLAGDVSPLPKEIEMDEILNCAKIWNLSRETAAQSSNYISNIASIDSWVVLASLVSSPYVPGELIDTIVRRIDSMEGFGYLLEVAARNPNLMRKTLDFIVNDSSAEIRFKKPALKLVRELEL